MDFPYSIKNYISGSEMFLFVIYILARTIVVYLECTNSVILSKQYIYTAFQKILKSSGPSKKNPPEIK